MATFPTSGLIQYAGNHVVAEVDQGIADFYHSLLPKHLYVNKQMYPAHVTVVRYEAPDSMKLWGLHEGREVEVSYDTTIRRDELYFWLDASSEELEEIRAELGLDPHPPWANKFHITIGNVKAPGMASSRPPAWA